jgi:hypothetical protein
MKSFQLFALSLAVVFIACKKTKTSTPATPAPLNTDLSNGFTSKPESINGYFYASYSTYNSNYFALDGYCVFRDPASDLMKNYDHVTGSQNFSADNLGNIQVNQVTFNGQLFSENNNGNSSINYYYDNSSGLTSFNYSAAWHTGGNGTYKALDVTIAKGFPKINTTNASGNLITYTLTTGNFNLDFSTMISNYDSLIIVLGSIGSQSTIVKRLSASAATSVAFTQAEISSVSSYYSIPLTFMAFNYSNQTVNNKVYVFELANKFSTNVYTSN